MSAPMDTSWRGTIRAVATDAVKSLGNGVKNIAVGTANIAKEMGCSTIDAGLGVVTFGSNLVGKPIVFEPWSSALKAMDNGDMTVGEYYGELIPNAVTFGTYGQGKALTQWWTGQISDEEMQQTVGGTAMFQILPGAMKYGPKVFARVTSPIENAMFAQRTYSSRFSDNGPLRGKTVDGVVHELKNGTMKPSDLPIEYAYVDGQPIILNTRSAHALQQAGIPRSQWTIIDVTNDVAAMARLATQLRNNNLSPPGIPSPVRTP
jgi:filamentous hemagglutinin